MGQKKVVLDSNVLISALGYEGSERNILRRCFRKEIQFYLTKEIIDEVLRVLDYPKFDFSEKQKSELKLILSEYGQMVYASNRLSLIKEDPSDNRFLECALAIDADYLITGDKHLLKLKSFGNTTIVRAPDFFRLEK